MVVLDFELSTIKQFLGVVCFNDKRDEHLPESILSCLDAGILRVGIMRTACEAREDQQHRRVARQRLNRHIPVLRGGPRTEPTRSACVHCFIVQAYNV